MARDGVRLGTECGWGQGGWGQSGAGDRAGLGTEHILGRLHSTSDPKQWGQSKVLLRARAPQVDE